MAKVEFHNVSKIFPGDVHAIDDLSLVVNDGEFLVLVGPSGCGKSTALRLVAGLEEVTSGEILTDNDNLTYKSPQERNVAMVFQNYALYPHKSVRKNLEFPLKMMDLPKEEIQKRIEDAAGLLGLKDYLDRKPRHLSGGQRQRVAMGRAIVRDPLVFLMDEPLSNLDAKLRVEIRAEIAELQKKIGITTIYVTHDQVEAMTLGDRVAVLNKGKVQQVAPSQELYDHPENIFVATFIGSPSMNIFKSSLRKDDQGGFQIDFGDKVLPVDSETVNERKELKNYIDDEIILGLRPESFVLEENAPEEQKIKGKVHTVEALGHELIIYLEVPVETTSESEISSMANPEKAEISTMVARLPSNFFFQKGEELTLGVDTSSLHFFNMEGCAIE